VKFYWKSSETWSPE